MRQLPVIRGGALPTLWHQKNILQLNFDLFVYLPDRQNKQLDGVTQVPGTLIVYYLIAQYYLLCPSSKTDGHLYKVIKDAQYWTSYQISDDQYWICNTDNMISIKKWHNQIDYYFHLPCPTSNWTKDGARLGSDLQLGHQPPVGLAGHLEMDLTLTLILILATTSTTKSPGCRRRVVAPPPDPPSTLLLPFI